MMAPEKGSSLLERPELPHLEVEPLDVIVNAPESEQDSSLDTLTTMPDCVEIAALLTGKTTSPSNTACCCCCCPACCCC